MTVQARPGALAVVPDDFVSKIDDAVSGVGAVERVVFGAVEAGVSNVVLLGCGGSLFTFGPLQQILDRLPVTVDTFNADEFVLRRPVPLGQRTLVIASSTHGTTAETARAAADARAAGATVVAVTEDVGSAVAQASEHRLSHRGVEAKQVVLAQLGWALLAAFEVAPEYEDVKRALAASPETFLTSIRELDAQLDAIACELYEEPIVYVLGAGGLIGAAQTFAACYLQEMQWKHAIAVGAGEFLHGPFEVVTAEVPAIVLKGEDSTRPMSDRVERFLRRYSAKVHVVDSAMLSLSGIEPDQRGLIATLVVSSAVLNRLAEHFEAWSEHPLRERRYMWKVEY